MQILKRLIQTGNREATLDVAILLLRLAVAALMLRHGWPKLTRLLEGGEIRFGDPIGLGPALSLILVVFAEFLCSVFIAVGLGTRIACIPLLMNMIVIIFIVHGPDPFGRKELSIFYLLIYTVLLITGSRRYSVDHLLAAKEGQDKQMNPK